MKKSAFEMIRKISTEAAGWYEQAFQLEQILETLDPEYVAYEHICKAQSAHRRNAEEYLWSALTGEEASLE